MSSNVLSTRSVSVALGIAAGVVAYNKASQRKIIKALLAGGVSAALHALCRILNKSVFGLKPDLFPLEEWDLQYSEVAVEPDIAIFDIHHHFFDASTHDKGWPVSKGVIKMLYLLKPTIFNDMSVNDPKQAGVKETFGARSPILPKYMGQQLLNDIRGIDNGGHRVVGTGYVECGWKTPGVEECMFPVKEVDMVTEVNRQYPQICQAIVAHADLRLGKAVEPALQYYSKNPLVKGIRHNLAWSDDPLVEGGHCEQDMAYNEKFREGFALLSKYGFSYDCWLYHEQIQTLADLARAFPDTTVICDHMAMPLGIGRYRKEESFPKWKESMKLLSKEKNVVVKIGGCGMRPMGFGFDERPKPASSDEIAEAWAPYVLFTIETFGVDRCMMESNFPMDKISCSYTVLFNALKKIVKKYAKEDKEKLFELNAKRVYRVGRA